MHEASIVQALLDSIGHEAAKHGARVVSRVEVSVGPLSGVEPELLRAAFDLMRTGTVAESAELFITTPPIACRCRDCGRSYDSARLRLLCDACGSRAVDVRGGEELMLNRLELELEEARHV